MKLGIAYKEIIETKYWLSLLKDTEYITINTFSSIYDEVEQISKMLFASIKKTRGIK